MSQEDGADVHAGAGAPIYDDKAHVRGRLDLTHAEWQRAGDPDDADGEYVEDALEARGDITVVRDARYVVDGNLVTSQGVSAGIDMALWLVGRLHGRDHARAVRRLIQYDPAPPYAAEV